MILYGDVNILLNDIFQKNKPEKYNLMKIIHYEECIENVRDDFICKQHNLLKYASVYNDIELLKNLLENGVNVNKNDSISLKLACSVGNHDFVELLLLNGANINAEKGFSLKRACVLGNNDVVKVLLNYNASARGYFSNILDTSSFSKKEFEEHVSSIFLKEETFPSQKKENRPIILALNSACLYLSIFDSGKCIDLQSLEKIKEYIAIIKLLLDYGAFPFGRDISDFSIEFDLLIYKLGLNPIINENMGSIILDRRIIIEKQEYEKKMKPIIEDRNMWGNVGKCGITIERR